MSLVDWVTTVYPSQTLGFWSIKQTNQAIADQMENKSNNFPLIHSEEFHEIYLWICFRLHSEWVCYSYSTLSGIGPRKLRCAEGGRDWLFRTDLIPLAWIWKWLTGCFEKEDMVGRIMATPQKCPYLFPKSCEYFTFHGKRDFANVIMVRISRCEIILD